MHGNSNIKRSPYTFLTMPKVSNEYFRNSIKMWDFVREIKRVSRLAGNELVNVI